MKKDNNIIFFDTSPLIYLIENHPVCYDKVADFIALNTNFDTRFCTSVITFMEFSVKPIQEKRYDVIDELKTLLKELDFKTHEINMEISSLAAKLRADYLFLKSMDALQLATAIFTGCSIFITNDKKLKNINEIKICIVENL